MPQVQNGHLCTPLISGLLQGWGADAFGDRTPSQKGSSRQRPGNLPEAPSSPKLHTTKFRDATDPLRLGSPDAKRPYPSEHRAINASCAGQAAAGRNRICYSDLEAHDGQARAQQACAGVDPDRAKVIRTYLRNLSPRQRPAERPGADQHHDRGTGDEAGMQGPENSRRQCR